MYKINPAFSTSNKGVEIMIEIDSAEMLKDYDDVLTAKQVMKALNLSKNKVYELLKNNIIASCKIGSIYRIPKSNVIRYLKNQE